LTSETISKPRNLYAQSEISNFFETLEIFQCWDSRTDLFSATKPRRKDNKKENPTQPNSVKQTNALKKKKKRKIIYIRRRIETL